MVVTKFNRPKYMGKPRCENAVGFDRVENLSPEVARRAAIAFLVHGLK